MKLHLARFVSAYHEGQIQWYNDEKGQLQINTQPQRQELTYGRTSTNPAKRLILEYKTENHASHLRLTLNQRAIVYIGLLYQAFTYLLSQRIE